MWFYIFLFIYCVFALAISNTINDNQKKYIEIPTLLILFIISGTRFYLGGTDYYVYKTVFDNLPNVENFLINYSNIHNYYITFGFESGYLFLNSIIKTLGLNFFGFTILHSAFFYFSLYKGLKKYTYNFSLLIIVFLYKMFFYNTFISMRQSITIGIFFLAMHHIEEKNFLKYFISVSIAVFFHSGALILYPIYFINKFKITKRKLIYANILFIPTILISFFNLPILKLFNFIVNLFNNPVASIKATNLFDKQEFSSSIGIFHTLEYFFIMILVVIFFEELIKLDNKAEFIIKLYLVLLPIFTLLRGYATLTRAKDYFILTYGILLCYLYFINKSKAGYLIQLVTVIICAYGFFRFIVLFDNGAMVPYQSFIFKNISIIN